MNTADLKRMVEKKEEKVFFEKRGPKGIKDQEPDQTFVLENTAKAESLTIYTGKWIVNGRDVHLWKIEDFKHNVRKVKPEAFEKIKKDYQEYGLDKALDTLYETSPKVNNNMPFNPYPGKKV